MKLEPRDILDIDVPDIRLVPPEVVAQLANWLEPGMPDEKGRDRAELDRLTATL